LCYDRSPEISGSPWYGLREGWPIIRAHYSARRSREELTGVFGHCRLRDLNNKVLVASFDLMDEEAASWKPKFFHNFSGRDTDAIHALLTLRSTRAPRQRIFWRSAGTSTAVLSPTNRRWRRWLRHRTGAPRSKTVPISTRWLCSRSVRGGEIETKPALDDTTRWLAKQW
jgi:hypothetical protein